LRWHEHVTGALLSPLGALYEFAGLLKERTARPFEPQIPVVCVGNLTAGGTGKTPLVIALARSLAGRRPYLLTRGYGGRLSGPLLVDPERHGASDVGDEALLLARVAPTIVSRKRSAGARLAAAQGAHLLLMDDGHQNFSLRKTLSLVIVDSALGFGNGRVLPAGPLRESARRGLARADALVLMAGAPGKRTSAQIASFKGPVFEASLAPTASLSPGPYLAFAGIGRPAKFLKTLKSLDADLAGVRWFADHHPYTEREIAALKAQAAKAHARLITTEKDLVRLPLSWREGISVLPVRAQLADEAAFRRFLEARLPAAPATL
jgi:tetraacyldisaccharide 4'-kinase